MAGDLRDNQTKYSDEISISGGLKHQEVLLEEAWPSS